MNFEWLCPTLKNFTGERLILLLVILADIKSTFYICDVCGGKAVQVLSKLFSVSEYEGYETYYSVGMSTSNDFILKLDQRSSKALFNVQDQKWAPKRS